MAMQRDDLRRPFLLDVSARGTVHIRETGSAPVDDALPVFSADTQEQAELIRVTHCRRANDGSGLYILNEQPKTAEDLAGVSDMFRATRLRFVAAAAKPASP